MKLKNGIFLKIFIKSEKILKQKNLMIIFAFMKLINYTVCCSFVSMLCPTLL